MAPMKLNKQILAGFVLSAAALADRPERPNFLIILADDLGWQDLKCYDIDEPSVFETPFIDALAQEGVLFRQAYAPAPTCAPSRSGILSGKYPARVGNTHVVGGVCPKPNHATASRMMDPYYTARLNLNEITIPEALAPYGYFSGHIGKWHVAVSHNSFPQPRDQGFDWTRNSRGITVAMTDRSTGFATDDPADPYRLDENGFAYDQTTEDALDFLSEAAATSRPFLCYYATWLVHTPIQMRTERLLEKYCGKMGIPYPHDGSAITNPGQNNPYYAAMVETLDYSVHRIVSYLKETDDPRWPGHKLIENTYIFLTSDNGGMEYANEHITDNAPLDEGKIRMEEGGTRVPFIAAGPGIPSNRVSEVMISGLDLYPTILSLAGIPIPDRLDGCDLSALLLNNPLDEQSVTHLSGEVRDTLYWHFPHGSELRSTIRKGGWKLFKNYDHVNNAARNPYELYRLYDVHNVRADIEEAVDLFESESALAAQLAAELDQWLIDVNAGIPHYNPKYRGELPGKESVPVVTATGNSNGVAWVAFSGHAERAELIYTLNGDGSVNEEWFSAGAVLKDGRAEALIPEGSTHYLFNLIDENNFLVSSIDVGQARDGLKDSAVVPPYVREPGTGTVLLHAGTEFPSDEVLIGNALGSTGGVQVKDNDATAVTQAAGQSFTLTAPARLSRLTLKSSVSKTFAASGRKMVLWIGAYSNNTAGTASSDTRVYEWVDFSGVSVTNNRYLTIDFPDTDFPAGTYAFQLAWPFYDSDHFMNFYRTDTVDAYPGGARLYKSAAAGASILLPFSNASVSGMENKDLVFALHGTLKYPPFSWDRVPIYIHFGKTPAALTDEEVLLVARLSDFVCLEKAHARTQFGATEPGVKHDTARLKAANPDMKVLYYWNTFLNYPFYLAGAEVAENPEWILRDSEGDPVYKDGTASLEQYNILNVDFRQWWAQEAGKGTSHYLADGIFADALMQPLRPIWAPYWSPATTNDLIASTTDQLVRAREAMGPGALVIINGAEKEEFVAQADGVMIEHFGAFSSANKDSIARDLETIERLGREGKIVLVKGWPGPDFNWLNSEKMKLPYEELVEEARENITFALACYLVAAQPYSYFCYSWGYREKHGSLVDYLEFHLPLGEPRGPSVRNGWVYTRSFEHLDVEVDLENRTASITADVSAAWLNRWLRVHGADPIPGPVSEQRPAVQTNLLPYAFGGDPDHPVQRSLLPAVRMRDEAGTPWMEYLYRRRRDAAKRGLVYSVELSERLRDAFWNADAIEETGAEAIDHEFESVTHRFQPGEQGFVRLKIEIR